jgi:hypothetical protein
VRPEERRVLNGFIGKYVSITQADGSGGAGILISIEDDGEGLIGFFDWGWGEKIIEGTVVKEERQQI